MMIMPYLKRKTMEEKKLSNESDLSGQRIDRYWNFVKFRIYNDSDNEEQCENKAWENKKKNNMDSPNWISSKRKKLHNGINENRRWENTDDAELYQDPYKKITDELDGTI